MFGTFIRLARGHKIITGVIVILVGAGGYYGYGYFNQEEETVTYQTAVAAKGVLISTVSGTGQVSTSNQVDISPKVSGDLTVLNIVTGQQVEVGELLAQIDSRDAARSVSEAKASLENTQLEYEELLAPADEATLLSAQNSLADARDSLAKLKRDQATDYQDKQDSITTAEDNLVKAYEDAYNSLSNTFLDLPDVVTGLNTILNSEEISDSESSLSSNSNKNVLINTILYKHVTMQDTLKNLVDDAEVTYATAKESYDADFDEYQDINRAAERVVIDELLQETIVTLKDTSDAIKNQVNMLDFWVEYRTERDLEVFSKVTSYQLNLETYTSKVNSHLSTLLSTVSSIDNYEETIANAERDLTEMEIEQPLDLAAAERSVAEKQQNIDDLLAGATELEIKSKKLSVQQKQNSLISAQQTYSDYFIKAPFAGIIASVDVAVGDSVGSGSSIATLITDQKIAELSLNEIDAAQVKVGQKATLTFDAVDDLTITGEVVEVDTIGAVNSGVVSYDIKIAFDVQDERIKSGMSVTAAIIVESKTSTLLVPITAVKSSGTTSYVEVMVDGAFERRTVETGLSNDTMIEIVSGLEEGDEVVTQSVSGTTTSSSSSGGSSPNGGAMRGMMMIR